MSVVAITVFVVAYIVIMLPVIRSHDIFYFYSPVTGSTGTSSFCCWG